MFEEDPAQTTASAPGKPMRRFMRASGVLAASGVVADGVQSAQCTGASDIGAARA